MLYLTQLVHVHEGREAAFHEFEDLVLPLLGDHGGELLLRLRPDRAAAIGGSLEPPYEVHVIRFPSEEHLRRYTADERRLRHLRLKEESVRSTLVIAGALS